MQLIHDGLQEMRPYVTAYGVWALFVVLYLVFFLFICVLWCCEIDIMVWGCDFGCLRVRYGGFYYVVV